MKRKLVVDGGQRHVVVVVDAACLPDFVHPKEVLADVVEELLLGARYQDVERLPVTDVVRQGDQ